MKWDNMHELFDQGFSGVKAIWSNTAGPCLVARKIQDNFDITVTLLSCAYPDSRAPEAVLLADWAFEQLACA